MLLQDTDSAGWTRSTLSWKQGQILADEQIPPTRGTLTMASAVQNAPPQFQALGHSQDTIRWRRFLEGMISKEIVALQQQFYAAGGSQMSLDKWSSGLITRLLEITHGQWLYWNFMVHDRSPGQLRLLKRRRFYLR